MTAFNGLLWGFCCGRENKLPLLALKHKKHFSRTLINTYSIHIYLLFPLKAILCTLPDRSEGNLVLPQVCSVHICMQAPKHAHTQRHMNAYRSVAQTHRWYKSVSSLLSLTPVQVGHKVWTDTYAAPHVYTAIWAAYPCGCALHTFLAWWMLQYSCQPGHPKHKLRYHRVPINRKLWLRHERKDWAAPYSAAEPRWTN